MTRKRPYSPSCLEEVFSETHLQVIERLCTQASKTPCLSPYRHTTLPQDVVALNGYAELSAGSAPVEYQNSTKAVPTERNVLSLVLCACTQDRPKWGRGSGGPLVAAELAGG
jgi:hypothetical protein